MGTWKVRARREGDWHRAMSLEHLEFRYLDCSTYVLFSLACSPIPLSRLYCVFCWLLRLCLRRHRSRTSVSGRCKSKFARTVRAVFIASFQGICPLQVFGILFGGFCAISDRGCEVYYSFSSSLVPLTRCVFLAALKRIFLRQFFRNAVCRFHFLLLFIVFLLFPPRSASVACASLVQKKPTFSC